MYYRYKNQRYVDHNYKFLSIRDNYRFRERLKVKRPYVTVLKSKMV